MRLVSLPEYVQSNKPGFLLEDAIENPTSKNAVIVEYEYGVRNSYIPFNAQTKHIFQPKPDPRYRRRERLVGRVEEHEIDKPASSNVLVSGVNPFFQIIYRVVHRGGITSIEDIVRALLREERVFSSEDETSREIIEKIVMHMNTKHYYILLHAGKVKTGFELPKGGYSVEYKKGYDPFEYHIMKFAEGKGEISREEIYKYIAEYLGWLKTLTKIDDIVDRLIEKDSLKQIQKNYFRFIKPLESFK